MHLKMQYIIVSARSSTSTTVQTGQTALPYLNGQKLRLSSSPSPLSLQKQSSKSPLPYSKGSPTTRILPNEGRTHRREETSYMHVYSIEEDEMKKKRKQSHLIDVSKTLVSKTPTLASPPATIQTQYEAES